MNASTSTPARQAQQDWSVIVAELDVEGYAILPGFLDTQQIAKLTDLARAGRGDTSRTTLEDLDLGRGEVWRTHSAVHSLPQAMLSLHERLTPIATRWNQLMSVTDRRDAASTALIELTRLREGGYQALHQASSAAASTFPLQLVALLSEPDSDFSGGQIVMTEQRPRMQSRPMVLPLLKGDAAIITTAHRPFKGNKGYYRVNMKHAISRVRSGERLGMEVVFNAQLQAIHG